MAIIDFLVPYGARKQTESVLKRVLMCPVGGRERVTIVNPVFYAERQRFFVQTKVFPPQDRS